MKITDIKFSILEVPLKTPFKTALRTVDSIKDVVIAVETDSGHIGYGEAPATGAITGDTLGSIIDTIKTVMKPRLIGRDISNLNEIIEIIQTSIMRNYNAKAAMEIAVFDLFAQMYNAPLYKILGGGEPSLQTDITISVDYIDKMVEDSKKAIALGFDILKIKVGKDIGLDIERVKAIHKAVKDKALIRLDANQGWTAKEAVNALRNLEDSGVELELIEQPVKADDLEGMRYITENVETPVMADESIFGPREVIELIQMRAADIINIKLMKAGGISNAIKIADIAATYNMECMIGCMLESSISVSAAAHVAVAKANIIKKFDLDGPSLSQYDPVVCGVNFNNAEITISDSPGLGIESIKNLTPIE